MEKRTMFRWHINHDLDLLREVLALRPSNPNDWNLIADNLQRAWANEEITLKGRSCKEHFDVLLRHHKDENSAALKKSGTEEQYNEIHQLLDDIRAYVDDLQQQSKKGKKKDEEDKKKANEFRDKTMETLKRKSSPSGSENSDDEGAAGPSAKKKELKQAIRTQELEYKRDALEAKTKLRQEQLEVDKRRISLQEQQMNMQLELLKAFTTSKK
ncbi:cingulin-like [Montipora foliosa]|uniref:cingulin-like n=1 Tax=Montipora foliosa TaxID=591990 RepID=UPI0035F16EE2